VAAIPTVVSFHDPVLREGAETSDLTDPRYQFDWGARYNETIISDSGDSANPHSEDLDAVLIRENVNLDKGKSSGLFPNVPVKKGTWDNASKLTWVDDIVFSGRYPKVVGGQPVTPGDALKKVVQALQKAIDNGEAVGSGHTAGKGVFDQYFEFRDSRTGTPDKIFIVQASGFGQYEYLVSEMKDGQLHYYNRVSRKALENNGAKPGELPVPERDGAEIPAEIK
jgi:hypothetical protein